jgi:hypothetical protein
LVLQRLVTGICLSLLIAGAATAQGQSPTAALVRLHDALHLSADQEPAWRDYTIAIAPTSAAQGRHRAADQLLPQLPTPRRIALIEATMDADRADFQREGQAVTQFYGRLTPDQQRTFDLETAQSHGPDGTGNGRPLRVPPGG